MVREHLGFMISDSQLQLASWRWLALTTSSYEKAVNLRSLLHRLTNHVLYKMAQR